MLFLFPWVPTQIPSFSIGGVLTTQILWEMEQENEERPRKCWGKTWKEVYENEQESKENPGASERSETPK